MHFWQKQFRFISHDCDRQTYTYGAYASLVATLYCVTAFVHFSQDCFCSFLIGILYCINAIVKNGNYFNCATVILCLAISSMLYVKIIAYNYNVIHIPNCSEMYIVNMMTDTYVYAHTHKHTHIHARTHTHTHTYTV